MFLFNIDFGFGLVLGIALGMIMLKYYERYQAYKRKQWFASVDTKNPKNQFRFLQNAPLKRSSVMGYEAYKKFQVIEEFLKRSEFQSYRVIPETCMSAFIDLVKNRKLQYSKEQIESGFRCKRIDFLIINPKGLPVLAIEYHGSGHFQGDYEARDKVKALTLHLASIPLLVLQKDTDKSEIINAINYELGKQKNRFR